MKPSSVSIYSVLLLRGAKKKNINDSWANILPDVYRFSKEVITFFPLNRDLIEPVDSLLDPVVKSLGTDFKGLRYLPNMDEEAELELLARAKYFIGDDANRLNLALSLQKPSFFFDNNRKQFIAIVRKDTTQVEWAHSFGFSLNEICFFDSSSHRYKRFLNQRKPQIKCHSL